MAKKKQKLRQEPPTSVYFSKQTKRFLREKAESEGRSISVTVIRIVEAFENANQ